MQNARKIQRRTEPVTAASPLPSPLAASFVARAVSMCGSALSESTAPRFAKRPPSCEPFVRARGDKPTHAEAHDSKATLEQRRLIRSIDIKVGHLLTYGGRGYRIIADTDLGRLSDRASYEVVGQTEAVQVLHGMSQEPRVAGKLAELLNKASSMLAADWRPPRAPEGLVLLLKIPTFHAISPSSEPALTPSQLYKPTAMVEIELLDTEGNPVPGEPWDQVLPDGSKRSGQLDERGRAIVSSIPEGVRQVTFPRLDADAWAPA